MNNLINIHTTDDVLVVSSREIANNFGKRHGDVLEKIDGLLKTENSVMTSMFIRSDYIAGSGKSYKEYLLTRDGFSLLVMGFNGAPALEWKLKYIDAFNKMEESLRNKSVKALPQTYIDALKALVQSEEEKMMLAEKVEEQQEVIAVQAPKVEYHDKVLDTGNGMNISVIAKELGMSASALNKSLKEKGIQYRGTSQWLLYSKYQDMGLVVTDTIVYQGSHMMKTSHHTKWTEKGRRFIHDLFRQEIK